ncbi:hypothetical protein [Slackia exigua]|uniref:hypothetical protein n=1 Tax=Slackia exigua TaxID=84109 RepID=UPI0023F00350|nr:hypothetical protein [Slackia exigua]
MMRMPRFVSEADSRDVETAIVAAFGISLFAILAWLAFQFVGTAVFTVVIIIVATLASISMLAVGILYAMSRLR